MTLRVPAGLPTLPASPVLRLAEEVVRRREAGQDVIDLTVGDFDPLSFRPPPALLAGVGRALRAGQTTYPPAAGLPALRESIAAWYRHALAATGLDGEHVLVAAGARPLLYASYRTLLEPGDSVAYCVPSWNNDAFARLAGARVVPIQTRAQDRFLPRLAAVEAVLSRVRLLVLNSPLNPTGIAIPRRLLRAICQAIVAENRRREARQRPPVCLLFDQVYWTLAHRRSRHHLPGTLVPAVAPYTVVVDAASKAFAATGLRIGWAVVPPRLRPAMQALLGHMGAWAPTAEQAATAVWLGTHQRAEAYARRLTARLRRRQVRLTRALTGLARRGLPVQVLPPEAGYYVVARIGRETDCQVGRLLLDAGVGAVPLSAFGLEASSAWFRFSVARATGNELRRAARAIGRICERLKAGPPAE